MIVEPVKTMWGGFTAFMVTITFLHSMSLRRDLDSIRQRQGIMLRHLEQIQRHTTQLSKKPD